MTRSIVTIIASAIMSGCASIPEYWSAKHHSRTTSVTWVIVDDADTVCRDLGANVGPYPLVVVHACALWNRSKTACTIYTERNLNTHILGHELRHCFEGNFH